MMSCSDTLVRVEAVDKWYQHGGRGRILALEGIELGIARGEFLSIVGPSGCGKTTLLRMLAGLVRPSRGTIRLRDEEVVGPHDDAGIVFQNAALLPWRKAIDNVLLPIELRTRPTEYHKDRAHSLLRMVGLAGFESRYPHELSGGMQQRVSICRALIHDPAFLLLDEPFGALDALTRDTMNVELNRLWMTTNKTAVLITHNIAEAVFLGQRVVVLSARPGRVVETVDIPFGREREFDLMTSSMFGDIVASIRGSLEQSGPLEAANGL